VAVGPGGHDVTLTHQHTIGIDIGKERQPVIAGHKLWLLSVCRGCQTGSQHETSEADQDLSHGYFVSFAGRFCRDCHAKLIKKLPGRPKDGEHETEPILPRVPCVDYRHHLRAVVAASAAPYGYTLTLWTAGAVTTHAQGLPSALDALLLLAGAVTGFAAVAAFAYGGITGAFAPGTRGEIRVWGGLHLPSVGSSILLVWVVTQVAHGHPAWLLVGFTATSTYLLVIGLQFWLATHRGHVPEPQDSDDPAG